MHVQPHLWHRSHIKAGRHRSFHTQIRSPGVQYRRVKNSVHSVDRRTVPFRSVCYLDHCFTEWMWSFKGAGVSEKRRRTEASCEVEQSYCNPQLGLFPSITNWQTSTQVVIAQSTHKTSSATRYRSPSRPLGLRRIEEAFRCLSSIIQTATLPMLVCQRSTA